MTELIKALVKAQADMPIVKQSQDLSYVKNGVKKNISKYAELADLVRAARPALSKNGLAHIFKIRRVKRQRFMDDKSNPDQKPVIWIEDTNDSELVTILFHESGDSIESVYPLGNIASIDDDKVVGKRISYAKRYSFKALVGIEEAEDPMDDGWGSASNEDVSVPPVKPRPKSPASRKVMVVKLDPEDAEIKTKQGQLVRLGFKPNAVNKTWECDYDSSRAKIVPFEYTIKDV